MIKNIIFDMGEVLVHFCPEEICERCTGNKNLAETLANIVIHTQQWQLLDEGTLSWQKAEEIFVQRNPEYACEIHEILAHYDEVLDPVDGMEELVLELQNKGYRLLILSNVADRYWNLKKRIPALSHIDEQVLSYEEKVNKPDRRIYETIIERYGLLSEECLFIDDRKENLEVPKQMGWLTCQFNGSEKLREFLIRHSIL